MFARVRTDYNAATFAAVRTATYKLRRTNNTAADVTSSSGAFATSVITAITSTAQTFNLPLVLYTTTNSNDVISLFGSIDVIPTAGSIDAVEANIVAQNCFKFYVDTAPTTKEFRHRKTVAGSFGLGTLYTSRQ
jgi:hypothetical protein